MGLLNTIRQIRHHKANTSKALYRHFLWQIWKLTNSFPKEIQFSQSKLKLKKRGNAGALALTNCLGLYDYNNMNFVRRMSEVEKRFVDIGANIGTYSLLVSENPQCQVHSFEPHPVPYKEFSENLLINGRENVNSYQFALGDSNGTINFTDDDESSINRIVLSETQVKTIKVEMRTAEEFFKNKIDPVLTKIDVEGAEILVLRGFGQLLGKVKYLVLEDKPRLSDRIESEESVTDFLTKEGFIGPLWIDYDARIFTKQNKYTEDPIYLSHLGIETLEDLGYKIFH